MGNQCKRSVVLLACLACGSVAFSQPVSQVLKGGAEGLSRGLSASALSHTRTQIQQALKIRLAGGPINNAFFHMSVPVPRVSELTFRADLGESQYLEAVHRYEMFTTQFTELRSWLNTRLYYAQKSRQETLDPRDMAEMIKGIGELEFLIRSLSLSALESHNPALVPMKDWLSLAWENISPSLRGYYSKADVYDRVDRQYNPKEFLLLDGVYDHQGNFSLSVPKEAVLVQEVSSLLPKNWRVAVLNDAAPVVNQYQKWVDEKLLGEGREIKTFQTIDDLLRDISYGVSFDLIITDMHVGDGSGRYLTSTLRSAGELSIPILASSSSPEAVMLRLSPQLYAEGFDGFFSAKWLAQPTTATTSFLLALKRYLLLRQNNGWIR